MNEKERIRKKEIVKIQQEADSPLYPKVNVWKDYYPYVFGYDDAVEEYYMRTDEEDASNTGGWCCVLHN